MQRKESRRRKEYRASARSSRVIHQLAGALTLPYRGRGRLGLRGSWLIHRHKYQANRRAHLGDLSGRCQSPSRRINVENYYVVALLVGDEHVRNRGIDCEITRCFALRRNVSDQAKAACTFLNREDRNAVIASIRGV